MKNNIRKEIIDLINRYPSLAICQNEIDKAYKLLEKGYDNNHKLLIAGNGGSAADSEHIAGELMKRFELHRPIDKKLTEKLIKVDKKRGKSLSKNLEKSLVAIPLTSHVALMTAYMNDVDASGVYAQQLLGYGNKGDIFLAISTSGNSENIINACIVAKALGIKIIGLTGKKECLLDKYSDISIKVPETKTYKIQELHLPVYHCLCLMLENHYFGKEL